MDMNKVEAVIKLWKANDEIIFDDEVMEITGANEMEIAEAGRRYRS